MGGIEVRRVGGIEIWNVGWCTVAMMLSDGRENTTSRVFDLGVSLSSRIATRLRERRAADSGQCQHVGLIRNLHSVFGRVEIDVFGEY